MFIFLLGRPGCGKSEVYRWTTERLAKDKLLKEFMRVDDFPKLWNIFMEDEKSKHWEHCKKTPDGGYLVTDDGVWDRILKEVNDDLLRLNSPRKAVFVEFSRNNYVHSMGNFSEKVLKNAVIVYIDCSFETCWTRNVRRHEKAVAAGTDDHLVSREEMEKTYLYDDKDGLLKSLKDKNIPVILIDTDKEGTAHLSEAASSISGAIRKMADK
jgi:adenylate kinase family enzyme